MKHLESNLACVNAVKIKINLHISVFSPNTGQYGPEKSLYLDTFHAVKNLLLARCRAFEHAEPTIIYVIKIFHLHYRELALIQSSLLTFTKLTITH